MRCPFCLTSDTQVIDSRASEEGMVIRRRRRCPSCSKRFTTFERVHLTLPSILKRGGSRTYYNRDKLMASMSLALRKRPVSQDKLEEVVSKIEHELMLTGLREIPSSTVGHYVLKALLQLDLVAYIRYASVYLNIGNPNAFIKMIEQAVNHGTDNGAFDSEMLNQFIEKVSQSEPEVIEDDEGEIEVPVKRRGRKPKRVTKTLGITDETRAKLEKVIAKEKAGPAKPKRPKQTEYAAKASAASKAKRDAARAEKLAQEEKEAKKNAKAKKTTKMAKAKAAKAEDVDAQDAVKATKAKKTAKSTKSTTAKSKTSTKTKTAKATKTKAASKAAKETVEAPAEKATMKRTRTKKVSQEAETVAAKPASKAKKAVAEAKATKTVKPAKTTKAVKSAKTAKTEKAEKPAKVAKAAKTEKVTKAAKATKTTKTSKTTKAAKAK